MMRHDFARDVRSLLTSPQQLCGALGWLEGAKRQMRGVVIRCPHHGERNPSCSVTNGPDGTVRARCFGCDWSADGLGMVALATGLSPRTEFRELLAVTAELLGSRGLADEIRAGEAPTERRPLVTPKPQPEPEYPPADEVVAMWTGAAPVTRTSVTRLLLERGIDFEAVAELELARVIRGAQQPAWAASSRGTWVELGYTLVLPAYDATGALRSVRAWRTRDGDGPKRLPPRGHRAAGLVQANRLAVLMLRGRFVPWRLWIVEGEPDYLTAATTFGRGDAVIGIGSGSWTEEHARRVPGRTQVIVSTHADEAGDRYAEHVIESLGERCDARRWRPAA